MASTPPTINRSARHRRLVDGIRAAHFRAEPEVRIHIPPAVSRKLRYLRRASVSGRIVYGHPYAGPHPKWSIAWYRDDARRDKAPKIYRVPVGETECIPTCKENT